MEPNKPSFNNKSLQAAYDAVSAKIDKYPETLDKVSEDIKSLEAYLQKSGIKQMAWMTFFGEPMSMMRHDLSWSEDAASKKMRVMFTGVWPEKELDPENGVWKTVPKSQSRPLIECPAETRMEAYRFLPDLLKKVGDNATLKIRVHIP